MMQRATSRVFKAKTRLSKSQKSHRLALGILRLLVSRSSRRARPRGAVPPSLAFGSCRQSALCVVGEVHPSTAP
jgi:hypothetical protein